MIFTKREFDALCRVNFATFFQRAWRELEPYEYTHNWHIDCLCDHLQALHDGTLGYRKIVINVPPRTGKTLITNVCFPAWLLGRDPGTRVLGISYAARLSEKIAYKQRILMETEWYKDLFPMTTLDPDQTQKTNFMTTKSGGRFSTSVGGTLTGEGGSYEIIDDPMNPAEALSDVKRISANEWVDQAVYTRLNNPKKDKIVLIMQRLHSDDTTGHFLNHEGWYHLKLPAETNEPIVIELNGKRWEYSDLLWPERLSREVLNDYRESMGSYAYAGQFLQEPVPLGGGEFKSDYLNYFASQAFDARRCNVYITVDPASGKDTSMSYDQDYTAMCVWALAPDQNYYVIDGIKERLNPTQRIQKLFDLHRKWNEQTGKPPKVGYEEYGLASDLHYIQQKQGQENYRFAVEQVPPKGVKRIKKEDRIRRLIPPMERGQIWIPNDLYYKNHKGQPCNFMGSIVDEEMLLFPFASHDDFLDAMSMLFDLKPVFPRMGYVEQYSGLEWGSEPESVLDL